VKFYDLDDVLLDPNNFDIFFHEHDGDLSSNWNII